VLTRQAEEAIMNDDWMSDARKIPDDVMNYIRRLAVHAVVDKHQNVDLMALPEFRESVNISKNSTL
jgi:hypothetical protein